MQGYNFTSPEHILPYLEPTGAGVSARWAAVAARKYRCPVAVGYPEQAGPPGSRHECYNSLVVVGCDGATLAHYRKTFLYYTDVTWAQEGQAFYGGSFGNLGRVAMGICM